MKLAVGFLLLIAAAPSAEIRYFQYQRPLQNAAHAGQACLVLDTETLSHAAPQLSGLRIYNQTAEVPWVLHVAMPEETTEKTITPLNLGLHSGKTVFDAAMPEGSYSDLQLEIDAKNFIATVTVSGSNTQDAQSTTTLDSYTIFDLTHQKLGRSTVLHLHKSDFPFLHFQIAGPIQPENVTGISFTRLPTIEPKFETVTQSSHTTQKEHSSILEFTVPANVPVDRITFAPVARPEAFSRNVSISVRPDVPTSANDQTRSAFPITASGNILRIHTSQNGHRLDEERLSIDASPANFNATQKWTVTIDNGDDKPLSFESVRLEMLQRKICFESVGNAQYLLYYGDPALSAPQYDYATLFSAQANAMEITPGPEQHNSQYQPRPDERPFSEKHPALLWTALVLVVVLLGSIAIRSAKRVPPASQ
jgi:Protein of unknown function (DUF3999)